MSKNAIVSFANSRGNYLNGIARLGNSLKGKFDGDFVGFIGEQSLLCPLHIHMPYAFKIYAIQRAIDAGYKKVLWVDSSVFAIKNIQPIFDDIEQNGMIFQEAGHFLGNWSSDKQLEYFGITRDYSMSIGMIGNAGFLGFDFEQPVARVFFDLWTRAMQNGMFNGSWTNDNHTESQDDRCKGSRHDMVCSSAIVHQLGLERLMKSGNEWLEYATPGTEPKNETILIQAAGL